MYIPNQCRRYQTKQNPSSHVLARVSTTTRKSRRIIAQRPLTNTAIIIQPKELTHLRIHTINTNRTSQLFLIHQLLIVSCLYTLQPFHRSALEDCIPTNLLQRSKISSLCELEILPACSERYTGEVLAVHLAKATNWLAITRDDPPRTAVVEFIKNSVFDRNEFLLCRIEYWRVVFEEMCAA